MEQIQNAEHALARKRWETELDAINFDLERLKQKQRDDDTTYEEHMQCLRGEKINLRKYTKEDNARKNQLSSLLRKFENYMSDSSFGILLQ